MSFGQRRQIKLKVLEALIKEVDKKFNGNTDKGLKEYIDETIKNFEDATDEKLEEALKCFRDLRDKK